MNNLISIEDAVKTLKLFRRCIIGARKILKDEGYSEESEQIKALAAVNAAESLCLIDLYITGSTENRRESDRMELGDLMSKGGRLSVILSDLQSMMTVMANHPYIRFETMEAKDLNAWKRWRKINVSASFPTKDLMPDDEEILEFIRSV